MSPSRSWPRPENAANQAQLTLGDALQLLRGMPGEFRVVLEDGRSVASVGSYRGYYEDLALHPSDDGEIRTVADLIALLDSVLGGGFEGYKGGTYTMHGHTDLWISEYSDVSGQMLTRILCRAGTDVVVLKTDEEVW